MFAQHYIRQVETDADEDYVGTPDVRGAGGPEYHEEVLLLHQGDQRGREVCLQRTRLRLSPLSCRSKHPTVRVPA